MCRLIEHCLVSRYFWNSTEFNHNTRLCNTITPLCEFDNVSPQFSNIMAVYASAMDAWIYYCSQWVGTNFNFSPDFQQRNGDTGSCAGYKVYGVDKLSNNSNLYKKKSTRPKLTLYLPTVTKYGRTSFVMTGNNVHVKNFCLTRFSIAKHPIFKQES